MSGVAMPSEPRACPGPDAHPHGPALFRVPPGAVDAHAHVIGSPPAHPFVDQRSYTPGPATPEDYLRMLDGTGMSYGVLVQVSVHGTDNRLLLQTLQANRQRLRGIAVMPLGLPESEYALAKRHGVVGLRLNVLYGGGIGLDALADYGALARDMGWHLQLLLDARELSAAARMISRLPAGVVFDHMGHFPAELGPDVPGFATLVDLVRDGAWVKLSGAYRLDALPYAATLPLARRLLAAAPERCVWGSDWPHVAHWGPMMNVGDLLDTLAEWAPDDALRSQVLVRNPQALYGFN